MTITEQKAPGRDAAASDRAMMSYWESLVLQALESGKNHVTRSMLEMYDIDQLEKLLRMRAKTGITRR